MAQITEKRSNLLSATSIRLYTKKTDLCLISGETFLQVDSRGRTAIDMSESDLDQAGIVHAIPLIMKLLGRNAGRVNHEVHDGDGCYQMLLADVENRYNVLLPGHTVMYNTSHNNIHALDTDNRRALMHWDRRSTLCLQDHPVMCEHIQEFMQLAAKLAGVKLGQLEKVDEGNVYYTWKLS